PRWLLGFFQREPAGQPFGHPLAQVVLGLGQQPPSLPGRAAQLAVQLVQILLNEVLVVAHARPPAGIGPPARPGPLVTAWTACAKRRHSLCSAVSAAAPLLVSAYT